MKKSPPERKSIKLPKIYRPFLDQPEYEPRYEASSQDHGPGSFPLINGNNYRREVASRAERFVPRAGFGPRYDAHLRERKPDKNKGPNELEIMATKKQLEKELEAEEKHMRLKDSQAEDMMSERLKVAEAKLAGEV